MATSIVTIIALIIQLLPQILSTVGVITPKLSTLIEQLGAAVPGVISAVVTNDPVDTKVLDLLRTLRTEIQIIGNTQLADPKMVGLVASLDNGITAALEDYQEAETVCDPSTLTPLPETF